MLEFWANRDWEEEEKIWAFEIATQNWTLHQYKVTFNKIDALLRFLLYLSVPFCDFSLFPILICPFSSRFRISFSNQDELKWSRSKPNFQPPQGAKERKMMAAERKWRIIARKTRPFKSNREFWVLETSFRRKQFFNMDQDLKRKLQQQKWNLDCSPDKSSSPMNRVQLGLAKMNQEILLC